MKRWTIVRTARSQSVAEHCFNVQRICINIAPWFNISSITDIFRLSQAALHHDDLEALTGDLPGIAKHYITVDESGVDVGSRVWYDSAGDRIKSIVKLADLLEAFHFLAMESQMGNWYLLEHKINVRADVVAYIRSHPEWPQFVFDQCDRWMSQIEREISKPYGRKSNGSVTGAEDGAERSVA